jgi:hypothetical protein
MAGWMIEVPIRSTRVWAWLDQCMWCHAYQNHVSGETPAIRGCTTISVPTSAVTLRIAHQLVSHSRGLWCALSSTKSSICVGDDSADRLADVVKDVQSRDPDWRVVQLAHDIDRTQLVSHREPTETSFVCPATAFPQLSTRIIPRLFPAPQPPPLSPLYFLEWGRWAI